MVAVSLMAGGDLANAVLCAVEAPVRAPISEKFREPSCQWCAGKRGIEYATDLGTTVGAGVSGTIWFAGLVGGVIYVVVRATSGMLVTHGRLREAYVQTGDTVILGEPIGQASERLYFGVRIDGRYIDPLRCMAGGASVTRRAILVPAPSTKSASGTS